MIPVFITTVAQRADFLPMLIERAGGESCVFQVFDPEMKGVWSNTRRALERGIAYCTEHGFTHFVTLQDDVWPVDDFQRHVSNAAAVVHDRVFSLFSPAWQVWRVNRPNDQSIAASYGVDWCSPYFCTAQGFVWLAKFASSFLAWVDSFPNLFDMTLPMWVSAGISRETRPYDQDDQIVGFYLKSLGRMQLATVPSLIQHLGQDSTLRHVQTGKPVQRHMPAQVYSSSLRRDVWNSFVYIHSKKKVIEYQAGAT